jgi:Cu/Ag efflux protein CusF
MMKSIAAAILTVVFSLLIQVPITSGQTPAPAPAEKKPAAADKMPAAAEVKAVKVHGTIAAIDKDAKTITLKGPKGRTVTLDVQDPQKLEVVKVGDPVVATYYEAIAIEVKKAGAATPGVTVQESRATSKPGENPAGAVAREVTLIGTITAVDRKAPSVTVKGPQGRTETVKVKDVKNIKDVKVGDMVELTYAQALVVALDKPPAKK